MLKQTILVGSFALFAFPACDDDGSGGDLDGGGAGGDLDGGGRIDGGGGDGSGVPGGTQIDELTPTQAMAFCSWAIIDVQGGENVETDCGDGVSIDTGTVAECAADYEDFPQCDLTVAQVELCMIEIGEDPCLGFQSPECTAFIACAFSQ